ncbi:Phage Mu protein F like protein [Loktanella sp. DSM 29012]|uniref:phage head morphogenesis protein n=1 Tax=Loktanella sp. DSM 29012 TaxID=1881056 RepID=UPI0008BB8817|nr:phage minor head protein [Loktanella sp. DSM 29012]SEQ59650.1 Phage Mu protein F like protein [Loktanella sp. DSM 29012]
MAEADDRPGYSFDPGPPPEASRFLANKGWQPAFSWLDVEPEEHAVAFSVAKATSLDVLGDIRAELQTALDDGLPFAEFQKRLRPRLQARGWWGMQAVTDPATGETAPAKLGTPRRLRTIYDANLRSARAAGQWDRIQRTKAALPYLAYRLGPSERHRPHHAAKEWLVLPVDDPFWQTWYPPNGWGCKCWVMQISRSRAEELGIDDSPVIDTREWLNNRTGETKMVPVGIDPGWDRNPGAMRQAAMQGFLERRVADLPEAQARTALRDMASSWLVQRVLAGRSGAKVAVGFMPPDIAEAVGNRAAFVRIADEYGAKVGSKAAPVTPDVMARVSEAIVEGPLARDRRRGQDDLLVMVDGIEPWIAIIKNHPATNEFWIKTIHRTTQRKWLADLAATDVEQLR